MFDTLVPLKALIGTFVIFVVFISLFIAFLGTMNTPNAKWLIVPLIIFSGIALLKCVQNIQEIISIKDGELSDRNVKVYLNTCPEYWVKDTIYAGEHGNMKKVNICKNYSLNNSGNYQFVGGSGDNFAKNFSIDESNVSFDGVLDQMNNAFVASSNVIVDEFTQLDDVIPNNLYGLDHVKTVQNPNNDNDPRMVTFISDMGTNLNDEQSKNMLDVPGRHIHYTGTIRLHDNSNISSYPSHINNVHRDLVGTQWHTHHSGDHELGADSIRTADYESNWINGVPSDFPHKGVEINLDRLNQAENICDLAKNVYWTEAYNKCNKKRSL